MYLFWGSISAKELLKNTETENLLVSFYCVLRRLGIYFTYHSAMQLFFFIGCQTQVCYHATNIPHSSFETESILSITTYAARILHVHIQ